MDTIDALLDILVRNGGDRYGDEAITQLQHALQCAMHAERSGATPSLVAAALLHDVGHLIGDGDEGHAARGIDRRHEETGADYLAQWFGPDVTEPIRLHISAKRYLCAVQPGYWEALSEASRISLKVQGGIYSKTDADMFIGRPHAATAVQLRRWDEAAKSPRLVTPPPEHYRTALAAAVLAD